MEQSRYRVKNDRVITAGNKRNLMVTGKRAETVRRLLLWFIFREGLKFFRNPAKAHNELKKLRRLRQSAHGNVKITKFIKSGHVYHWVTDYPGYPSEKLKHQIRAEFRRNGSFSKIEYGQSIPLQTVIWSVTNRCPLRCSHCSEWDHRDSKDHMSLEQLKLVLAKIEKQGIKHVQLGGGEPLIRFNDLIELIRDASERIDFWLLTSGYGLTPDKALALKEAGLRGIQISLDHYDETAHNLFRNNQDSYQWALKAVENCRNAGIIVSLSLCATQEFTTLRNLETYANLARTVGAHFIRIMEPSQTGRYAGQNVRLNDQQIEQISDFAIRMNSDPVYKDCPIIIFFGYQQRNLGCSGAGNRYLYIDPDGYFHACPFCRGSVGNALTDSFDSAIGRLRKKGCHAFKTVTLSTE